MHPILLKIGPLTLHTYGLMVAVGFLVGYFFTRREFESRGLSQDLLDKSLYIVLFGGLFGARLFYVLFVGREYFLNDPLSFFRVWEGGLVFFGGFILAVVLLWFYAKYEEVSFFSLADSFAAPLLLAQSFGRLGCFSAGCCYGRETEAFLGVTFRHPESLAPLNISLIPTQLIGSMGNLFLFFILMGLSKKKRPVGFMVASYLIGYGVFRFFFEFLRNDYRGTVVASLFPSQWIALLCVIAGLVLIPVINRPVSVEE